MHSLLGSHGRGEALLPADGKSAIRIGWRWCLMSLPMGCLGAVAYMQLAPRVLGEEFTITWSTVGAVATLSAVLAFAFSVGVTLNVTEAYREQPIINLVALSVTAAGSFLLAPTAPLAGSFVSVGLGQCVRVLGGLIVLAKH